MRGWFLVLSNDIRSDSTESIMLVVSLLSSASWMLLFVYLPNDGKDYMGLKS